MPRATGALRRRTRQPTTLQRRPSPGRPRPPIGGLSAREDALAGRWTGCQYATPAAAILAPAPAEPSHPPQQLPPSDSVERSPK